MDRGMFGRIAAVSTPTGLSEMSDDQDEQAVHGVFSQSETVDYLHCLFEAAEEMEM